MNNNKVLITGSSGLIGSALIPILEAQGFQVFRLLRQQQADQPYWDIDKQIIELKSCPTPDIVIHLAGENITSGRWSESKKQQLLDSRVLSTELLVDHFKQMDNRPRLFICASAIGYYGNRGQQVLTEQDHPGCDYVSLIAKQWEQASQGACELGIRVVNLRSGIVLSNRGGALNKMLLPFKLGLGGQIGNGKQVMSWIDINDWIKALIFIINHPTLSGPVNLTAPNPVNNKHFTKVLATQLHRPALFPLPAAMVKLLFAQMGEELLLSSSHVLPKSLIDAGFEFDYETIEKSMAKQLEK